MLPDGGFAKTLSWLGTNKLAYYGPETLTGTTTTSTGILTGSYTDPATKLTVPFAGAVLQKQGLAGSCGQGGRQDFCREPPQVWYCAGRKG